MVFRRFGIQLGIRLALLFALLGGIAYLAVSGGYPAATLLLLGIGIVGAAELSRFVTRTNQELSRFLDAIRYADFGQRFSFSGTGAGFTELGDTFTHILDRFRADRSEQERELRHLKALLEHVPVPLISVFADGRISLWNNAARRLFGQHDVQQLSDLGQFGTQLMPAIERLQPGDRALVQMQVDDLTQSLAVSASEIVTSGRTERLISLHNIQTELDGMQLDAWQALVRVLTHEIMNSITPLASLASTSSELVRAAADGVDADHRETLDDAQSAVDTLARRADGLTSFVGSYRQLLGLPEPERTRFAISELFSDVLLMVTPDCSARGIRISEQVEPATLALHADRAQIEQVLINLIRNAMQAVANDGGEIRLSGRLNLRGHTCLEVSDNGPGIPDEVAGKMFVPFFTTRSEGSGVGLALSRQIMNAHGGSISYLDAPGGGARFTLVFGS